MVCGVKLNNVLEKKLRKSWFPVGGKTLAEEMCQNVKTIKNYRQHLKSVEV